MLSGLVQRCAKPVEKMFARVLTEAGASVLDKQKLADRKLPGVRAGDHRQIEIFATNLSLKLGIPLACDAAFVSPLRANVEAKTRAATVDGAATAKAEEAKTKAYPELVNSMRCRLIVLAGEVGSRWSGTCVWLINKMAEHRCKDAPKRLRKSIHGTRLGTSLAGHAGGRCTRLFGHDLGG